ncbi:MAG: hypothetical protein H7288_13540 [Kineosporiaceae bacterium]|nr:hypothetical protein [Aeromicrobium sp.]
MPDRYTHEGSEVLRNSVGIEDPAAAHELETEVAYYRLVVLSEHPTPGKFDLAHLQAMHCGIYSDL